MDAAQKERILVLAQKIRQDSYKCGVADELYKFNQNPKNREQALNYRKSMEESSADLSDFLDSLIETKVSP